MMNFGMQDFGSGPGGPMISGKWFNKKTNQTVTVRDALIDGDNMIIMTDKGQIPMQEFSNFYIQVSDDIYDQNGNVIDNKKASINDIKDNKPQQPIKVFNDEQEPPKQRSTVNVVEETKNEQLIRKIFEKNQSRPELNLTVNWADFPQNELKMLINYFDISEKEISDYIIKNLIDSNLLSDVLSEWLKKNL